MADSSDVPPSMVFLRSEGTQEDFQEFFRRDPIGAAQYAAGLAQANQQHFEGLEQLQQVLEAADLPIEQQRERLAELMAKNPSVIEFVEKTEAQIKAHDGSLGWKTSDAGNT